LLKICTNVTTFLGPTAPAAARSLVIVAVIVAVHVHVHEDDTVGVIASS
jgi:hypothetical protein